ncbi:MAG: uracil-DNA glycosylase [Planctomycetota bacterium]|nr:uracil-DNA glycosylase [Planctomycetota bacterium]
MNSPATRLASGLTSDAWRLALLPVLSSPGFHELAAFLETEREGGSLVLPPQEDIFAALNLVEPDAVRVVILGQDPYPTPGHAHGLAFSYRGEGTLPRSLGNIVRELEQDLGVAVPAKRGDLTAWARQGVLLLNTVLTVRAGEAGSHRRRGWEAVTDAVLAHLDGRVDPCVFLLWGGDAKKKRKLLASRHTILEAGHPSPLSVKHFRGCRHFSRANEALAPAYIDWAGI